MPEFVSRTRGSQDGRLASCAITGSVADYTFRTIVRAYYHRDLHILETRLLELIPQRAQGLFKRILYVMGYFGRWILRGSQ